MVTVGGEEESYPKSFVSVEFVSQDTEIKFGGKINGLVSW